MTLVAPLITPLGDGSWLLSWTGTANRVVRVFVAGVLVYGPVLVETAAKRVSVALPNPATLEVHENPEGETVPAHGVPLERRPLIWFRAVEGASSYRVYIDDTVRAIIPAEPSALHHETILTADVRLDEGAWRDLRVEAVSAGDVETVSAEVDLFVPGLPLSEPTEVEISGTGGVFDIEVTA